MAEEILHASTMTETATEVPQEEKMTRAVRYYMLHREECLARRKANYDRRPDVIQRREEKEKKQAEKEAAKQAAKEALKEQKRAEKEKKLMERLEKAKATARRRADETLRT